jgi:hypothetical protein
MLHAVVSGGLVIVLLVIAGGSGAAELASNTDWSSLLLPKPRMVKWMAEALPISRDYRIVQPKQSKATAQVAERLDADLAGCGLAELRDGQEAKNALRIRLTSGRRRGAAGEKYSLKIGPDGVSIDGAGPPGLFYGTRTLLQMLQGGIKTKSLPYCRIEDWPDYRYRMVHYDLAREQVANVEYLKKVIDTLSYYKINMLKLYFENRFQFKKHPLISPPGSMTADQARELDAYAQQRFVELVPEVNTMGHLEQALQVPEYRHLAEDPKEPYEICPSNPEATQLIDDMISEVSAAFKSRFFHVGGDETSQTGTCPRCAEQVKTIGKSGLYLNHFMDVHKIAKAHGLRMMMWGDMLLNHKDIVDRLPKDVIVFDWHYENSTEDTVRFFRSKGLEVFVCPAMSGFSRIAAPYAHATDNIYTFLGQGKEAGAIGECTCAWELRLGHLFENDYFGMILSADKSWNASITLPDFNRRFCKSFFGLDDNRAIDCYRMVSDGFYEPLKDAFGDQWNWQPIAYGYGLDDAARIYGDRVNQTTLDATDAQLGKTLELLDSVKKDATLNRQALDFLDMPARAHDFAARQVFFYKQALDLIAAAKNGSTDKATAKADLDKAEEMLGKVNDDVMYFDKRFTESLKRYGSSDGDLARVAGKKQSIKDRMAEIAQIRAGLGS